jgi:hypothetical protein
MPLDVDRWVGVSLATTDPAVTSSWAIETACPSTGGGASDRACAAHAGTRVAAAIANAAGGGTERRDDGGPVPRDDGGEETRDGGTRDGGGFEASSDVNAWVTLATSVMREGWASGRPDRIPEKRDGSGAFEGEP